MSRPFLTENRLPGAPAKPKELVVMSWAGGWGMSLQAAVSRPFSEITGIAVRHHVNIGLKLPAILIEQLESNRRPPFDVVWSNVVPAITIARRDWSDLLDSGDFDSDRLSVRANPEGLNNCPFICPYITHYVLAYVEDAYSNGAPESWAALIEPRFKGRIALYPGGNGFYPIAQIMGGGSLQDIPGDLSACWSFFRRLAPQVGTLDYSVGMGELIRRRDIEICFRALPNALAFRNEGLPVKWAVPKEGVTDTLDALWVPRRLPDNVAFWAKKYVAFALSRQVQERWCGMMGVLPVHLDADLPEAYRTNRRLPKSPDDLTGVLHISETLKADHEAEWESRFAEIFGR